MDNNKPERKNRDVKPWYQVWWIWIIIVIAFIIMLVVINGKNDSSHNTNNNDKTTQQASDNKTTHHARKSIKQDNDDSNDGDSDNIKASGNTLDYNGYQTKVNKVTYWGGDHDMDTPDSGKQFVIANVTITNNQASKADYNPYDYKLSDNGNETDFDADVTNDKYAGSELSDGSLQSGASVSGNLIGQSTPGHKLQLVYTPNMFEDKSGNLDLN